MGGVLAAGGLKGYALKMSNHPDDEWRGLMTGETAANRFLLMNLMATLVEDGALDPIRAGQIIEKSALQAYPRPEASEDEDRQARDAMLAYGQAIMSCPSAVETRQRPYPRKDLS